MRILVIIIAILALIGGAAHLAGGLLSFYSSLLMLTAHFPPEVAEAADLSPHTIGMIFILIGFLMLVNGLVFIIFAVGAFMRKRWARLLGIFGYALNIVVFVVSTLIATEPQGSLFPYIFGSFVAAAFIVILGFSKSAFENPFKI